MTKYTAEEARELLMSGKGKGMVIEVNGDIYLGRLTTLPEGVTILTGGWLALGSLTTLSEGVTISARYHLYLGSMTTEEQVYQGKKIRLRTIDGICTRMISKRKVRGVTLWSAQYFKGHLETDKRCYVAQDGDIYAHGDTSERALRDLRFKIAQVYCDASELAETIRQRGTVTFNDYRLITGACESGLIEGLKSRGVDPDVEELPLDEVIDLCRDGYGGAIFIKTVEGN